MIHKLLGAAATVVRMTEAAVGAGLVAGAAVIGGAVHVAKAVKHTVSKAVSGAVAAICRYPKA